MSEKLCAPDTASSTDIDEVPVSTRSHTYGSYLNALDQLFKFQPLASLAAALLHLLITNDDKFPLGLFTELVEYVPLDGEIRVVRNSQKLVAQTMETCHDLVRLRDNEVIEFSDPTVKEFLLQLTDAKLAKFSAFDIAESHYVVVKLYLQYMQGWYHSYKTLNVHVRTQEITKSASNLTKAWTDWPHHARQCQSLLGTPRLSPILRDFLDPEAAHYQFISKIVHIVGADDPIQCQEETKPVSPLRILIEHDLVRLLEKVPFPATGKRAFLFNRARFRRLLGGAFKFDLDLDMTFDDGSSLLHMAAENGSINSARYLLSLGATGNTFDLNGHTPFSLAVFENFEHVATLLMNQQQAFPEQKGRLETQSLHAACGFGMKEVVSFLLSHGQDIDQPALKEGWTPFLAAVSEQRIAIMRMLASRGANLQSWLRCGRGPLQLAVVWGDVAVVRTLFDLIPQLDPASRTLEGCTMLSAAAQYGHVEVFSFLQKKCPELDADELGWLPVHFAAQYGHGAIIDMISMTDNLEAETVDGRRPLHIAAANGQLDIVQSLIARGADPMAPALDFRSNAGAESRTFIPILPALLNGHVDVVEYLSKQCPRLEDWRNYKNATIVHEAARYADIPILRILVNQFHCDLFHRDDLGNTILHKAALSSKPGTLEYLWSLNTDAKLPVDTPDMNGDTLLSLAVKACNPDNVKFVLALGADPNVTDRSGTTCLMFAIGDDLSILEMLIEAGARWNQRSDQMETALSRAAKLGNLAAMQALLDIGTPIDLGDRCGITALQDAATCPQKDAFFFLLQRGAQPQLLNKLGYCALDYVLANPAFRTSPEFGDLVKDYIPVSDTFRIRKAKPSALQVLRKYDQLESYDIRSRIYRSWLLEVSAFLWAMNKQPEAVMFYEAGVARYCDGSGEFILVCRSCWDEASPLPFWRCRRCFIMVICNKCYQKRESGVVTAGCEMDHTYLEMCGEKWKSREPGTVDGERSLGELVTELIREFEEVDEEEEEESGGKKNEEEEATFGEPWVIVTREEVSDHEQREGTS